MADHVRPKADPARPTTSSESWASCSASRSSESAACQTAGDRRFATRHHGRVIVVLSPTSPELIDLDRLDRLHAELHGELGDVQLRPFCERVDGDDDHVWLDIAAARVEGLRATESETFGGAFDAMIAFARSKGWLNASGSHVRAHVERAD